MSVDPKNPPPIDVQRAFWNDWDTAYRDGKAMDQLDPDSVKRGTQALRWVATLQLAPNARIIEVGCANGWLCERLTQFGQVTGTDIADEVIARAQARWPGIRFIAGDFMALDLPRGGFDVVVCLETLSCVEDQQAFLVRLGDLLAPGGHLILTTHNRFVYERCEDIAPQAPGQIRHWLYWRELRDLLRSRFRVLRKTTLGPRGHRGILRLVNSYRLAALFLMVASADNIDRLREALGFGQSFAVLAERRADHRGAGAAAGSGH